MHGIAFWLGVVAIVLGAALLIVGATEQRLNPGGVIAAAIGLVVVAVARRGSSTGG